ncbi:MAG: hypothetical protein KKF62_10135 [Bacteroidetes bacterium]|nr:hypothetical protein [Bacteroidota bacterium]MBU1115637.1 hypothetical protein [Bacteroidota bacterium]MBU1799802.1 hypothetical protein [Bacteroidota bacterium]
MGGKGAILLVLSFSVLFLVLGSKFNWLATNSVDNLTVYYSETRAHNIAVSAANLAANAIFFDGSWDEGFDDIDFNEGKISVVVTDVGDEKLLTCTGTYNDVSKEVKIRFKPSNFAKFAYYMNLFGGADKFVTGDTIWGPFHTNGKLTTVGSPVFMGKATTKLGLKMFAPKDPKFYGGYESGVDVPFEFDTTGIPSAAATGGKLYPAGPQDVRLIFNSDATVTHSTSPSGSGVWSAAVTEPMSTFAPNGVVWNPKGNLYVSGTVNGKYTIGVGISSGIGSGNVYIEDDLVYRTDPIEDPTCTDMLGIVSGNNVFISDLPANYHDVNIHASILASKGGLSVENLNTFPNGGDLYIAGGIIGYQNQSFGLYSGTSLTNGFHLKLKYDERFMVASPPHFPLTDGFEIVSWFE